MPEQEKEFTLNVDVAVMAEDEGAAARKLIRIFHKRGLKKWWIGHTTIHSGK